MGSPFPLDLFLIYMLVTDLVNYLVKNNPHAYAHKYTHAHAHTLSV